MCNETDNGRFRLVTRDTLITEFHKILLNNYIFSKLSFSTNLYIRASFFSLVFIQNKLEPYFPKPNHTFFLTFYQMYFLLKSLVLITPHRKCVFGVEV